MDLSFPALLPDNVRKADESVHNLLFAEKVVIPAKAGIQFF